MKKNTSSPATESNAMPADKTQTPVNARRRFLQLGLAVGATTLAGCPSTQVKNGESSPTITQQGKQRPEQGIDLEKWKRIRGKAYETGSGPAPGVCQLPGPMKKKNWPDINKYKDTTQVPGMCQLCSTCLLYTSPSPRDLSTSRMPSSA